MTDNYPEIPEDWVLIEAAKRSELRWLLGDVEACIRAYKATHHFRALCDMIQKYEQPPVDRKLLCAREAMANKSRPDEVEKYRAGIFDCSSEMEQCIRAIELWEEGFGRD